MFILNAATFRSRTSLWLPMNRARQETCRRSAYTARPTEHLHILNMSSSQEGGPSRNNLPAYPSPEDQNDVSFDPLGNVIVSDDMLRDVMRNVGQRKSKQNEEEEDRKRDEEAVIAAEKARQEITAEALSAFGIHFDTFQEEESEEESTSTHSRQSSVITNVRKDFFGDLGNFPELLMEIAKFCRIKELVLLYAISKDFHYALNSHWKGYIMDIARHQALDSVKIFPFNVYRSLCTQDPIGLKIPNNPSVIQTVPGLKWLQMVVHREKMVRDILACMARQGHGMPKGMALTLKKTWLLMDMATSRQRIQFMHSKSWNAMDLYHVQMFVVKLDMRFNDPIDGPGSDHMRKLFLGQRGLTPLRNLLKRTAYNTCPLKRAKTLFYTQNSHFHTKIILQPDTITNLNRRIEAGPFSAFHLKKSVLDTLKLGRKLDLKNHIMTMMLWGYVDPVTGKDTPATDAEKYMSDDEEIQEPGWDDYEDPSDEDVERAKREPRTGKRDEDQMEDGEEEDQIDGDEDEGEGEGVRL
ncbi:hypothetical protein G7Y89_g7636 [Cudoniella acicularis]|uniref:Uncharacterized protein n=1 Tax=Cudoniella acicularis TaxID=354080 RepID=A0A8H4RKU9_9HELO|nr:hypothetical protein G7Y89_g7636 [Cudoniella acicularis]